MAKIIEVIEQVNSFVNNLVWGWPVMILILGTGILLTVRTRALQVSKFGDSLKTTIIPTIKSIGKKQTNTDGKLKTVSQFEAFSAAISGTVGTGNIIGVTSAILTGGPGAVLWMWISAFFGMVTNYAENVLGLYYRKKDKDGNLSGGPMYYIAYGLKWKWLAYIAGVFVVIAAIGMSGVQTSKISGTIAEVYGEYFGGNDTIVKLVVGIVVSIVAALIIIGGIKRIGKVASMLVPSMSLLFIVMALITIIVNITAVPSAFALIFKYAFNFKAAGGGILGYAFAQVIRKGLARGIFSNEAGLGSSVIAHSASETREPVKQGLWGMFEVFFTTIIICTVSALIILTSGLYGGELDGAALCISAFNSIIPGVGGIIVTISTVFFALSTISTQPGRTF